MPTDSASHTVASPDGRTTVTISSSDGNLTWAVSRDGEPLLKPSTLGVRLNDGDVLGSNAEITSAETSEHDETWTQPWGEIAEIRDHHRQLRVATTSGDQGRRMDVVVRVFDDGLGLRYEWPEQDGLGDFQIMDERTGFTFARDGDAWWIRAYEWHRYEYLYEKTTLQKAGSVLHTPMTVQFKDGPVVCVHEAALVDYAAMSLRQTGALTYDADLAPWSTGVRVYASAPHVSPWRVLMIADAPAALVENTVVLNLNEPNKLGDVSWVEPGKYVGIWWAMHLGRWTWGSGPDHGATTEHMRRYIDFAAEHGFSGVLAEGWNVGWDGDWISSGGESFEFTTPYPDYDFDALAEHARERGTRIIGHHETGGNAPRYEREMDEAFAYMAEHDVNVVKTGYVQWGQNFPREDGPGLAPGETAREWNYGQYMAGHYHRTVEAAAKHRIALNIHESVKDTGLRRTYPNLLTREAARGQEYNLPGQHDNGPAHVPTLAFTRMLAGPMDFTPGTFDLDAQGEGANRVPTTLAGQLALYVVIYSPLQMASDLPEHYEPHMDAFQFIRDVPVDWSHTRGLAGEIGHLVAIARKDRQSDDWFLGAKTDGHARMLDVPLDFLDADRTYTATLYKDGCDAHWRDTPLALDIETREVTSGDRLSVRLAHGGGLAVRFSAR